MDIITKRILVLILGILIPMVSLHFFGSDNLGVTAVGFCIGFFLVFCVIYSTLTSFRQRSVT